MGKEREIYTMEVAAVMIVLRNELRKGKMAGKDLDRLRAHPTYKAVAVDWVDPPWRMLPVVHVAVTVTITPYILK